MERSAIQESAFAPDSASLHLGYASSDGTVVIDPDGPEPLFEVPVVPPLPEELHFIP